jgi:hypothetical protein
LSELANTVEEGVAVQVARRQQCRKSGIVGAAGNRSFNTVNAVGMAAAPLARTRRSAVQAFRRTGQFGFRSSLRSISPAEPICSLTVRVRTDLSRALWFGRAKSC